MFVAIQFQAENKRQPRQQAVIEGACDEVDLFLLCYTVKHARNYNLLKHHFIYYLLFILIVSIGNVFFFINGAGTNDLNMTPLQQQQILYYHLHQQNRMC